MRVRTPEALLPVQPAQFSLRGLFLQCIRDPRLLLCPRLREGHGYNFMRSRFLREAVPAQSRMRSMSSQGFALVQLSLGSFAESDPDQLTGRLANGLASAGFDAVASLQISSWRGQISALQAGIKMLLSAMPHTKDDTIILEYTIPVIRRRLDAVLLHGDKIVVLEYKHGHSASASGALHQAQDYALDLADFHEHCRRVQLFPLAMGSFPDWNGEPIGPRGTAVSSADISKVLIQIFSLTESFEPVDQARWALGRYFPVPQVIEAAVAAFNGHQVEEIAMSRSDPGGLERSKQVIVEAVASARQTNSKILCVLTGVPGAGKTLAGLNAVSKVISELELETEQAAYLSGNTPLVNVLREALYRDRKERGERVTKTKLEVLIQEMHRFVADNYQTKGAPSARMIVFDEAQRAWSRDRNLRKFGRDVSEPGMVFEIMDRHEGWAVVVALVGGGQEIHDGEAGIEGWGEALLSYPNWTIWASPAAINGGPALAGSRLFPDRSIQIGRLIEREGLHLDVSLRSIDAENSAAWVNAILEGRSNDASSIALKGLPIYRCRSLLVMRKWLAENQTGSRRSGLVASSAAQRLRAIGVETPTFSFMRGIDYVKWFLEPAGDVRSSNQLEVALSEFEVQGLELDFVGLIWGGDLLFDSSGPLVRKFSGSKWQSGTRKPAIPIEGGKTARAYQEAINRYRVLMTRYRKAMVICVPEGASYDPTRNPDELDGVYEYLGACGLTALD